MIEVIGFDLDGTLYPSTKEIQKRIRNTIYQKLSSECGIEICEARFLFEENYDRLSSGSRAVEEIAKKYQKNISGVNLIQDSLQEADILDLLKPNPALADMLTRLSQEYPLDLITGSRKPLAINKLERLGINQKIFSTIWGKETGDKLSGELFKWWIEIRNKPASSLLYVGDNTRQDIDTPKSLGIQTCYTGRYSEADYQIKDILELEELVKRIK